MSAPEMKNQNTGPEFYGLLAEFRTPDDLLHACEAVRDAGYTKWDSHMPYPVHHFEEKMGIRMTILPWIVLGGGITGLFGGLAMAYWMNGIDYPWIISGKPLFSLPAFFPIMFELTILLAAFGAFFGMWALNKLPEFHHPVFTSERFKRATNDRFFIHIAANDPVFEKEKTRALLEKAKAVAVEDIFDEGDPRVPSMLKYGIALAITLTLIPAAVAYRARHMTSPEPRVHVFFNMDNQPIYKTQKASPFFADGRTMRKPVEGTVARDEILDDPYLTSGLEPDGDYGTGFPGSIEVTESFLRHGKSRYEVFCAVCHGIDGAGNGMIHQRAQQVPTAGWVPPTNLHERRIRTQPEGMIYETILKGRRNMPPYGHQMSYTDAWSIVAYVRALQLAENAPIDAVPTQHREQLK